MAEILFHCPDCEKALAIDEAGAGKMIRCPQCGTIIQIPPPSLRFHCPACNTELCTPSTINPSSMHCPSCDSALPDNPISAKDGSAPRECISCHLPIEQDAVICISCGVNQQTGSHVHARLSLRKSESEPDNQSDVPVHVEHPSVEMEPTLLEKIIPEIMVITLILILILGTVVVIKRAAIADFLFTKCTRQIPPNQQVTPPVKKPQEDMHVATVNLITNRTLQKTAQTITYPSTPPPAPASNVVVRIMPKSELPKPELQKHETDTVQPVAASSNALSLKAVLVSGNVAGDISKVQPPSVSNNIPQKAPQTNDSPDILSGGRVVWGMCRADVKRFETNSGSLWVSENTNTVIFRAIVYDKTCLVAYHLTNDHFTGKDVAVALPARKDLTFFSDDDAYLQEYKRLKDLLKSQYGNCTEQQQDADITLAMNQYELKVRRQQEEVEYMRRGVSELEITLKQERELWQTNDRKVAYGSVYDSQKAAIDFDNSQRRKMERQVEYVKDEEAKLTKLLASKPVKRWVRFTSQYYSNDSRIGMECSRSRAGIRIVLKYRPLVAGSDKLGSDDL